MFVEGTLAGVLGFEPQGEEPLGPVSSRTYLLTIRDVFEAGVDDTILPELVWTSSASFGSMQYDVVSAPDDTPQSCLQPPARLTHRKYGPPEDETNDASFNIPFLSIGNSGPEDDTMLVNSEVRMFAGRRGRGGDFWSRIGGKLGEVCDIEKGMQIQCLPRQPFVLEANQTVLKPDDDFQLSSVAQVQTPNGVDPALRLQSPDGFNLSCSLADVERKVEAFDRPRGFIVRTIPLFVEAPTDDGKTHRLEQLCPVLTLCFIPGERQRPTPAGQTEDGEISS